MGHWLKEVIQGKNGQGVTGEDAGAAGNSTPPSSSMGFQAGRWAIHLAAAPWIGGAIAVGILAGIALGVTVPGLPALAQSPQTPGLSPTLGGSGNTPSPEVADVQQRLQELGYYQDIVDGIYGDNTRAAIARFQQASGLARTGILDPLTQARLDATIPPRLDASSGDSETLGEEDSPLASAEELETTEEDTDSAFDFSEETLEGEDVFSPGTGETVDNGEANGEAAEAVEGTTDPEAAEGRSFALFLAIGLGVILVATLGGGALWLLLRRPGQGEGTQAEGTQGEGAENGAGLPPAQGTGMSAVPGEVPQPRDATASPEPTTGASPGQNGHVDGVAAATITTAAPQRLNKVNIVDELIDDLHSGDPAIRRKAIWDLGQQGNSTAVQPLVGLMVDADSQERSLILATLSEISSRTLKPLNRALALSLQDENPEVRKNAIRDLTRIYDLVGQVGTLLGHAAGDEDPEVRQTAVWAMEQFSRMRLKAVGGDQPTLMGGSAPQDLLPPDRGSHTDHL